MTTANIQEIERFITARNQNLNCALDYNRVTGEIISIKTRGVLGQEYTDNWVRISEHKKVEQD